MELSELSLRVEKLEEIIQELAKWTNFNLSTKGGLVDNFDGKITTRQKKKKTRRFTHVAKQTPEISNAVLEDAEDPMSSVVIKMELEEDEMESGHVYNWEQATNNIGDDVPENVVEWNDRLSNCDEDPLFLPSDGGEHSESASDFEEPPLKRRKRSTKKFKPLKVPHKSSLSPSAPFVSLRPLTASQRPKKMHQKQKPNDLKCPSCPRKFKMKIAFNKHIRSGICQREARRFACPHCPYAAALKSTLSYHVKSQHPATEEETLHRPFNCPECPKTFRFKGQLTTHISNYHNKTEKTFLCDSCPYLGKNLHNFQQHIRSSHKEHSFFCYFCPWKGRRMDRLTIHLRSHTGEKPYKCPHCAYSSNADNAVKGHVKAIHGKEEGSLQCPKCPSKFKTESSLTKHLQKHDGSLHKCGICGFQGFNEASLREHLKCHKTEDGQKFQCPHCEKSCKRREELTFHIRIHTGEKPYKCGKCLNAFTRKKSLKNHEKICEGNRKEKKDPKDGEELPEDSATTVQDEGNYVNELNFLCNE